MLSEAFSRPSLKVELSPTAIFVETPQLVVMERLLELLALEVKLKLVAKPCPCEGGSLGIADRFTTHGVLSFLHPLAVASFRSLGAI